MGLSTPSPAIGLNPLSLSLEVNKTSFLHGPILIDKDQCLSKCPCPNPPNPDQPMPKVKPIPLPYVFIVIYIYICDWQLNIYLMQFEHVTVCNQLNSFLRQYVLSNNSSNFIFG